MKYYLMILPILVLAGCNGLYLSHAPVTASEQALLDNPPDDLDRQIRATIPEYIAFNKEIEALALENGRPLNVFELEDARKVGVQHPEKVRIYIAEEFPGSDFETLASQVGAVTAGYGIFIKPAVSYSRGAYREIVAHELAHVSQFERFGFEGMGYRALLENTVLQNKLIPLERDAIVIGEAVYDDPEISYGF